MPPLAFRIQPRKVSIVRRFAENPLICTQHVRPSREDAVVFGVFNCGAVRYGDEILLLLRIAEKVIPRPGYQSTFILETRKDGTVELVTHSVPGERPEDLNYQGYWCLPYHSHLRLARSRDGIHFTIPDGPSVPFMGWYDQYGMEDPRITFLEGRYYINYSAISRYGVNTVLLSTTDFVHYDNHGIIFCPDNKDVALFPEKVKGKYCAFHRPDTRIMGPSMWLARSPDLVHWGQHQFLIAPRREAWDSERVGCGSPPIRSPKGWIALYHGNARDKLRYCMGALLLDGDDPSQVLARSPRPVLAPDAPYENEGYLPGVVFCCGHVEYPDGRVVLYYGAADDKVCAAETSLNELLDAVSDPCASF